MTVDTKSGALVRVPDLLGLPLHRAELLLECAGFEQPEVLFKESYEQKNTVVQQKPSKGQVVNGHGRIVLWVARRGCVEHLPALYRRADALGRNVVRDVCYLFDHLFGSIEDSLENSHEYFDPVNCPPDFLPWLASWTALSIDSGWDDEKKRALISRAVDLYRIRGTKKGMALFLKLFTGHEPEIEEHTFPLRGVRTGVDCRVGLNSVVISPPLLANCFVVTLPVPEEQVDGEFIMRVHRVIQMERPAHTHYYLRFAGEAKEAPLEAFFTVGVDSRLGAKSTPAGSQDKTSTEGSAAKSASSTKKSTSETKAKRKSTRKSTKADEGTNQKKTSKRRKKKTDDDS